MQLYISCSVSNVEEQLRSLVRPGHTPQKPAPEIGAIGPPKFDARFGQSRTLEVVHRYELAPESGVEFMTPISGPGFWSVCQWPNSCHLMECVLNACNRLNGLRKPLWTISFSDYYYLNVNKSC